jgi:putative acetyltransferase
MIKLLRTDSSNKDFRYLVRFLDAELQERDGDDHAFYAQFNKLDMIRNAVVAYLDGQPVGCGAIKPFSEGVVEVKRMFVPIEYRRRGISSNMLQELERWAAEMGFSALVLETGKAQPEAISLYQKSGYALIPNYGQYAGVENSVCMKKTIPHTQEQGAGVTPA